ncbi:MAG: hypothetical protein L0Z50_37660 [Verrucomicrobiales bacterium]|nr:hypothetical protein [Verrucomicrobiales bacterium]
MNLFIGHDQTIFTVPGAVKAFAPRFPLSLYAVRVRPLSFPHASGQPHPSALASWTAVTESAKSPLSLRRFNQCLKDFCGLGTQIAWVIAELRRVEVWPTPAKRQGHIRRRWGLAVDQDSGKR